MCYFRPHWTRLCSELTRQNSKDSGYEKTPPLDKKMKGSNIIINLPYDYLCATAFTNETQDTTASHCVPSGTPDKSMIVSEMSRDDETSIGDYPLQLNTLKCTSAESMYSCKQDNCVGDLSKKENTDLVECAKQLSNCIDTNHNNISILPTKYVCLENNIESVAHNDDSTDKSNPYITPTHQYLSRVQLHSFSTDIFKQDHDQEQQTDTCNLPDQSQKCGIIRSINASNYVPFDATSFIPSQPDTDNAGSEDTEIPESSDSIVSPKLDIDLTFLSAFGNAPGMNPESPSFSTMTESVKNATSNDDAYSSQIPVEFDQRKDSGTVADLDTIDDHNQLQYCIKYASDEEQNLSSVPSSDEETPFCSSHEQKPKSNFTSDYVPHSLANIVQ
ncbi:uncharacterized protein LOC132749888 [Ruditapes philippinarum]|uniref:uncharacterized protein LOC132749888 n=1 Tax=Ruditapes philippinarum TaxID=129788 RepID=UPI00295B858F|nr:uncharacterized protein LOC132749888 [Ruditapes philippinarum]